MVRVKVPATSANMGPGFDCLGVAVGLYNSMEMSECENEFYVYSPRYNKYIPGKSNNLIYRAMNKIFDECGYKPKGIMLNQYSNIPVTRGLGSSSACIIGGMLGANVMSGRPFEYKQILNFAAEMEGHPDNVAPALYGGFCTSVMENGTVYHISNKITEPILFAVMYPDYPVATRDSRTVVPDVFSKEDAVYNISRATLLTSALCRGKLDILKIACDDRMHQQYRKGYITGMDDIFNISYELGAYCTYLSGSGPTVMSIIDKSNVDFSHKMNNYFANNLKDWKCTVLTIDNVGAVVCEGLRMK